MAQEAIMRAFIILGCPRSGTTWLHNAVIGAGRFRGVPGDDHAAVDHISPFVTDENRYLQFLALQAGTTNKRISKAFFEALLPLVGRLLYCRFGLHGELQIKSPYYCFYTDLLSRLGAEQKFVYMRRSLDAVALSMLRHPHISSRLNKEYEEFFDMLRNSTNMETRHVPSSIDEYFRDNYRRFSRYDRALFKCLCFSSAFAAAMPALASDRVFVFDHVRYAQEPDHRDAFAAFAGLSAGMRASIEASFEPPRPLAELPPHDARFRKEIIGTEAALWSSPIAAKVV
jgi:hypothetical protein